MIADACLRAGDEAAFTADLAGYLAAHGVDADDAAAILAAPPRLALYRRLVRNNLTGVTETMLARTRARLNEAADGAFDASVAAFLSEVGPRSHYLREVPGEFLAWALSRWAARAGEPGWPAWIGDFARHELLEYEMAAAETSPDEPDVTELAPDRALVFAEPVRLVRYDFAVHALPKDAGDRTAPDARTTQLAAYYDDAGALALLEMGRVAHALLERLINGEAVATAVTGALADVGPGAESVDVAALLADLAARGIILGAKP
jgi:hypothetical protein